MNLTDKFLFDKKAFKESSIVYSLGISIDRGIYYYCFQKQNDNSSEIILMKEFKDELKFKYEVEALSKIFECKVFSDTYDLLQLKL